MLTNKDMQTFEAVARSQPRFREFLVSELERQTEVLIVQNDIEKLRIAQGYARCLQSLIGNLDDALKPRRTPAHNRPNTGSF